MDPVPFALAASVAGALVAAVLALWHRANATDKRNEEREKVAANRCEKEIGQAVERIRHLEERSHTEQHEYLAKCLDALQTNARAFERLVDLETSRHSSGAHPTIKGIEP